MIKANELRIGNWVIDDYGQQKEVTILLFEIFCNTPNRLSWFNPVPLTPEILLACRFEFIEGYWFASMVNGYRMKLWSNEEHDFMWAISNWNSIVISSLHQLQNLYFALTGTELTYTP